MKIIQMYLSHMHNDGFELYRTVPNQQLIGIVDGEWHTITDDDTWEEPIGPIKMDHITLEEISKEKARKIINQLKEKQDANT